MNVGKRGLTIALVLSVLAILTFGQMSSPAILALSVGTLFLAIGIWISYRPAAVFGFMSLAIGAGIAVEVGSLADMTVLLSAVAGILVPVCVLGLVALSTQAEGLLNVALRSRATATAVAYAVLVAFSVPILVLVIGILTPQMSTHITVISEAALMLLVTAIGVIVLTSRGPRAPAPSAPEEAATEEA